MTEMIAAEPAFAERLLGRLGASGGPAQALASAVRQVVGAGGAVEIVGCGTSEHGALAASLIMADALRSAGLPARVGVVQAFEAALQPSQAELVLAISHEGGTWATNLALRAARDAGAQTALITVSDRSPAARLADLVVATEEMDQSWCHTVGYLSPILAAAAIGAALTGSPLSAAAIRTLLSRGADQAPAAERIAAGLADAAHLLVVASGADRPAARELALKVEEASYLPATMRDLETILHGHLPATDGSTGLVLILADPTHRAERVARAIQVLAAAGVIGLRSAAILAREADAGLSAELTPLGRLLVDDAPELPAPVAALLGTAAQLQLLTERLARARRTNPDTLRRTDARYREAAARAE